MIEKSVPVWPRLDPSQALAEFDILLTKDPDGASKLVDLSIDSVRFYETAIHRVDGNKLFDLRGNVVTLASEYGFPGPRHSGTGLTFDQRLAVLFESEVPMLEVEASLSSVWQFMTLRVLPDVAIWRWPGDDPNARIEEDGAQLRTHRLQDIRRNVFRQAWFRQNLLGPDACRVFDEDAFVQLTDRMSLLGNRSLNYAITQGALLARRRAGYNRKVLRYALRIIGQACGRIAVESIGEEERDRIISECFDRALLKEGNLDSLEQVEAQSENSENGGFPAGAFAREVGSDRRDDGSAQVEHSAVEQQFLKLAGVHEEALIPTLGACDFRDAVYLLDLSKSVLRSRSKPHKSNQLGNMLNLLVEDWSSLSKDQQSVVASTLRFSIGSARGAATDQWRVLDAPEAVINAAFRALRMNPSWR